MSDQPIVIWLAWIVTYAIYYPGVVLVMALFISWIAWYLSQVNRHD